MRKPTQFLLLLALAPILGLLLISNAPTLLGPVYDRYQEHELLVKHLASCRPDEVRLAVYYGKIGSEIATFNFTTKTLDGDAGSLSGGAVAQKNTQIYGLHLGFHSPPFNYDQVEKIKSLLAALPPPANTGPASFNSYRDQFHLAFYQGANLRIYHYSKTEARPQLEALCAALQIVPHLGP